MLQNWYEQRENHDILLATIVNKPPDREPRWYDVPVAVLLTVALMAAGWWVVHLVR